jgi:hypothetical protein
LRTRFSGIYIFSNAKKGDFFVEIYLPPFFLFSVVFLSRFSSLSPSFIFAFVFLLVVFLLLLILLGAPIHIGGRLRDGEIEMKRKER